MTELPTIERLVVPAQLHALEAEWIALWEACPSATPFQRPEWIVPWTEQFAAQGMATVALRCRGRLVGLAPWFVYARDGQRVLTFLGGGITDYHDALLHPEWARPALSVLFDWLAKSRDVWDLCELESIRPESPLATARLPGELRDHIAASAVCPVLRKPEGANDFAPAIPTAQLAKFRKYRRRAERRGRLRLL